MAQRESISFYNELTNLLEMENTNAVIGIDLSKIKSRNALSTNPHFFSYYVQQSPDSTQPEKI